jgi:hypothetical protein
MAIIEHATKPAHCNEIRAEKRQDMKNDGLLPHPLERERKGFGKGF